MADVFISYKSDDRALSQLLAASLKDVGFSIWFDEGLGSDEPFHELITKELLAAGVVVAVWSERAADSRWVYSEANEADQMLKLINVRIDGAPVPKPFDRLNALDFHGWRGDSKDRSFVRLVEEIRRILDRSAGVELGARHPPVDAAGARAWVLIQDELRPSMYDRFISTYPHAPQATYARVHLEQLSRWERLVSELAEKPYKIGAHIIIDRIGRDPTPAINQLDEFVLSGPF